MVSLSIILLLAVNYNFCLVFVEGDCGGKTEVVWSSSSFRNQTISLNESGYCFLNECTIRIKESNVLLNIINKTEDWIAATDSTNLFTVPATSSNNSVTYCSGEDDRDITLFIFYTVAFFIICILCSLNIVLHLAVKELRSTPGLLIVGICGTIIMIQLFIVIVAVFQYLHRVNGNTAICGVLKFIIVFFIVLYTTLKATYLFHFAYLMYRTYMSRPFEEKNKTLLYIYAAINVTVTTISSALMVTLDLLQYMNAFKTYDGYCTSYFFNNGTSEYLYSNYIPAMILLAILTAIGIIFFVIGLTMYLLTTKHCCACSGMTGQNYARVSIALTSATALGALILVVLLFAGVNEDVTVMAAITGVFIEQVILLIVFLTSTKAQDKLKKCFQRKKTVTGISNTLEFPCRKDIPPTI